MTLKVFLSSWAIFFVVIAVSGYFINYGELKEISYIVYIITTLSLSVIPAVFFTIAYPFNYANHAKSEGDGK